MVKMYAGEENMQKSFINDRFSYFFEINIMQMFSLWVIGEYINNIQKTMEQII